MPIASKMKLHLTAHMPRERYGTRADMPRVPRVLLEDIEVPIDLLKKHHSLIHNQVVSTIETLLYVTKQRWTKARDVHRYSRDLWTIKDISKQKTKPAFKMQNL